MKIKQAIEFLEEETGRQVIYYGGRRDDAIRLGIEAMKRLQDLRYKGYQETQIMLPGETKE